MANTQTSQQEFCHELSTVIAHLSKQQLRAVYGSLFFANIFFLFLASSIFVQGQACAMEQASQTSKTRRRFLKLMILCLGCTASSLVIVIVEACALLTLQFCEGEHLISLFWSTWSMLQVGSFIAMVGILLALVNLWKGWHNPPWALALGTPVLVIAGVLFMAFNGIRQCLQMFSGKSPTEKQSNDGADSQSEVEQVTDASNTGPNGLNRVSLEGDGLKKLSLAQEQHEHATREIASLTKDGASKFWCQKCTPYRVTVTESSNHSSERLSGEVFSGLGGSSFGTTLRLERERGSPS